MNEYLWRVMGWHRIAAPSSSGLSSCLANMQAWNEVSPKSEWIREILTVGAEERAKGHAERIRSLRLGKRGR